MKKRVLIADDVKSIRMVLRRMLEKFDQEWEIQEADAGGTIMDVYFQSEPDIILLDVELPEVDGWEILRCIREIDEKTRIVMVTASEEPQDVLKAVELGADGFVGKPFDIDELADALGVERQSDTIPMGAQNAF